MSAEPVVVARFNYRHEAEFAQTYLAAAGIESAIFADDAGGAHVALSFSNSVRVLVSAEDEERARAVLNPQGNGDSVEDSP